MAVKERIQKWDILKFFLIFLVVFGHMLDVFPNPADWMKSVFLFIYTFHMPVFIFISGMFSKRNVNEKRYSKIFVYLILYFITKAVLFLSNVIAFKTPAFSMFFEGGVPWYMMTVFACSLITIALRKFSPSYVLIFSIILSCLSGYDDSIVDMLSIPRIVVFFPFFYAGYCIESGDIIKFSEKKPVKIISAFILIAFAVYLFKYQNSCYWLRPLITGRNHYQILTKYNDFGALLRLAYYAVVTVIGMAVICLTPKKLGKGTVARWGSRSLQVYILHYALIYIYLGLIDKYLPNVSPTIKIIVLSVLFTAICSLKIWEPTFKKLMNLERNSIEKIITSAPAVNDK